MEVALVTHLTVAFEYLLYFCECKSSLNFNISSTIFFLLYGIVLRHLFERM